MATIKSLNLFSSFLMEICVVDNKDIFLFLCKFQITIVFVFGKNLKLML